MGAGKKKQKREVTTNIHNTNVTISSFTKRSQ